MSYSSNLTILFWVYSSRAVNNQATIHSRLTINGKKTNFSLNRTVDVRLWDARSQRLKGYSSQARQLNEHLIAVKSEIIGAYKDLISENKMVTGLLVKNRYLGLDKKHYTIKNLIEFHNTKMTCKLCAKTVSHYKTSQKYLMEFILSEYNADNRFLKDLDYQFILGFESFLRLYYPKHSQSSIGTNTVMKHIQRIRKMITLACHMEWIEKDPFVKFRPKMVKTSRDFLTKEELKKIENLEMSIERIERVKDIFIFSCYTGISYSDLMSLTKDNLKVGIDGEIWIMANRNKTGVPYKVPLLEIPKKLIKRYSNKSFVDQRNSLLPKLSNQRLNSYLKEIADLCEIHKNLTFHMARHTFATTVTLSNGVPIETVSKLLGHTKMSTTQIYARVIEEKISGDMEKLQKKLKLKTC